MKDMRYLKGGETLGIVAPGFAVKKKKVQQGIAYLKSLGFNIAIGRSVFKKYRYFAGKDDARTEDLNHMLEDPEVRCIIFARGGFGTSRIIDQMNFEALRKDPKLLVGYSDLTSLFLTVNSKLGIPCLYGPVAAELGSRQRFNERSFLASLHGKKHSVRLSKRQIINAGTVTAKIGGGCLTLISTLIGTSYDPDFRGKVLFLEEVGEEPYRIDRLLNHLSMAGKFEGVKGVIIGKFVGCTASRSTPGRRSLREIAKEYFGQMDIPVLYNFPAGHCERKVTIPLGGDVKIDTDAGYVELKGT